MSLTDEQLYERGRAISALSSLTDTKRVFKRYKYPKRDYNGYYRTGRWERISNKRFPKEKILIIFNISAKEYDRAIKYYRTNRPTWNQESIYKAVIDFTKKNSRWPTYKDLTKDHAKLKLPSETALRYHFQNRRYMVGALNQVIENMVNDNKWFKEFTPKMIMEISNVTVRRTAMEKFGVEKLLKKIGDNIQQDDYGKLWKMPSDNDIDDHSIYVEVVNATKEPNGRYAHYFLRVPPTFKTAQEAVAWTFQDEKLDIKIAT